MMKVRIGALEFEVTTYGNKTNTSAHSVKMEVTLPAQREETTNRMTGDAATAEVKAALKAMLAFIS